MYYENPSFSFINNKKNLISNIFLKEKKQMKKMILSIFPRVSKVQAKFVRI
jgi:hypothetical protein